MTTLPSTETADVPRAGTEPWALAELMANRRWVRRDKPFPHVVAQNVFVPDFYAQLAAQFGGIERDYPEVFQRNMAGYDASSASVARHADGPLGVFVSREWHDLVAGVAGVRATGDVHASLHHHQPGGSSGWPHNDLNPGWFEAAPPTSDEVRLTSPSRVDYAKGPRSAGIAARETIRAASVLFYLGNPPWQPEDGGETGLFANADDASIGPAATVAPVNNSLVVFECTPFSWHAFISNRKPRNSVVMWLHCAKHEAVARWGEQSIVYW